MREIKFRAWDKRGKSFVYFTVKLGKEVFLAPDEYSEELCLFTGLNDKNGKEIYEGDIMQWKQHDYISQRLEKVVWHESGWWIADLITGDLLCPLTANEAKLRTIIGNIYENPELLKEKP